MIQLSMCTATLSAYGSPLGYQQTPIRAAYGDQDHVTNGPAPVCSDGAPTTHTVCPKNTFPDESVKCHAGCCLACIADMTARRKVLARQSHESQLANPIAPFCETYQPPHGAADWNAPQINRRDLNRARPRAAPPRQCRHMRGNLMQGVGATSAARSRREFSDPHPHTVGA